MAKIIELPKKIQNRELEFSTPHSQVRIYWEHFINSELGGLYQSLPLEELKECFKKNRCRRKKKGPESEFDLKGKIALMFLKPYSGLSDKDLMARMSTDYSYQFFCGVYYKPGDNIPGYKLISDIRCELSDHFKPEEFQKILSKAWKPYMQDTHAMFTDATCYESYIRYPTDIKLLWEGIEWTYEQMRRINKQMKGRMPRSKYIEIKNRYMNYQRNKKKTYKKTHKLAGSLLYLLNKLEWQLNEMDKMSNEEISMPSQYNKRRGNIKLVYRQQRKLYETGERSEGMIVSIDKSYLRPIVRGKEVKRVEFGAKVNMIQVDGINFIEHLSYRAFNEGIRLISSIRLHRELFGKCTHVGADKIYATNKNRTYCRKNNIVTSFVPKGKLSEEYAKDTKKIKSILSKERATRMEGSFGTQKNHYTLDKIKARKKTTEELWIFFGVHTANAVLIAERMTQAKKKQTQAA